LARQNNLEQLAPGILQVTKQPDLLEDIPVQILSLINNQRGGSAGIIAID
jgi:hypothetical protein